MPRTYYIVQIVNSSGKDTWSAYSGFWARLGFFGIMNKEIGASSWEGADDCERQLQVALSSKKIKPKVIRVVKA